MAGTRSSLILGEPIELPEEVAAFHRTAHQGHFRAVALGDSITKCEGQKSRTERWPAILESMLGPNCLVVNAGIGGTTSALGLFRWGRDVAAIAPHCVIINFLLNDANIRHYECRSSYCVQDTVDRMASNLLAMVELCRGQGAVPIFWTPPPVPRFAEAFPNETHYSIQMEILEAYLGRLEQVARLADVALANFWRTFPSLVKEYPGPYFDGPDGYHSNTLSQPILAQGIFPLVKAARERWGSSKDRVRSSA